MNWRFWENPPVREGEISRALDISRAVDYSWLLQGNFPQLNMTVSADRQEEFGSDFQGLAQSAYKSNSVVYACMAVRNALFSEARFQFRQIRSGRPGDLFGTAALELLEEPWVGGTTRDLLGRMLLDADLAGNFFGVIREGPRLRRLRPDWMRIVIGGEGDMTADDIDAQLLGYLYYPGGTSSDPVALLPEEVVHFAPEKDPEASYRGMSWLTPLVREIMADKAATERKLSLMETGTPNMIVKVDKETSRDAFDFFEKRFREKYETTDSVWGQFKTLFLGGGADATVVGSSFQDMAFKEVQGAGETRIAAAAQVPPVLVGLSEGLASATYSNYGMARRRFADGTMRPLWGKAAGCLAPLIDIPGGSELWYDDRDIPFLQEDVKDAAEIQSINAAAIRQLVDGGYKPESVVDAITSGDLTRLQHTALFSVQLQPPGTVEPESPDPVQNGNEPAALRELAQAVDKLARREEA